MSVELLERQSEILSTLYGDGLELSDEDLESSINVSGQSGSDETGSTENSPTAANAPADDRQDTESGQTSGNE